MTNCLTKNLYISDSLFVEELVLFANKSLHQKMNANIALTQYYIVSGCLAMYLFDIDLKLIDTVYLASGELYTIDSSSLIASVLMESLDTFKADTKLLKTTKID